MKAILLAVEAMTMGLQQLNEAARSKGFVLRVLAEDPDIYWNDGSIDIVKFPTRNYESLCQYVAQHQSDIANIFSPTTTWGVSAAKLRVQFAYSSSIDAEQLQLFCDKDWVRKQLGEEPSDVPQYIIKPRFGTGSMQIHLAHNPEQVERIFTDEQWDREEFVVEPYYTGAHYSAEVWCSAEQFAFCGISNRIMSSPPVFVELVKSFPHCVHTEWEDRVAVWVKQLLKKLDYRLGFAHIEFVETASSFRLIELNARIPGALITPSIYHTTNYNPYAMVVEQALGLEVDLPKKREIRGGYSHMSIYAEKIGILNSITFPFDLSYFPGNPTWFASIPIGTEISHLNDYRARVGNLAAFAPNSVLAQDYAITAGNTIKASIGDK